MAQFGYTMMCAQSRPDQLVRDIQQAEAGQIAPDPGRAIADVLSLVLSRARRPLLANVMTDEGKGGGAI